MPHRLERLWGGGGGIRCRLHPENRLCGQKRECVKGVDKTFQWGVEGQHKCPARCSA